MSFIYSDKFQCEDVSMSPYITHGDIFLAERISVHRHTIERYLCCNRRVFFSLSHIDAFSYRNCSVLCCYYIYICVRIKQNNNVNDFTYIVKLYINTQQTCEGNVEIYFMPDENPL